MIELKHAAPNPEDGQALEGGRVFKLRIDSHFRIVSVNDAWLEFAMENSAPELNENAVVDQELWRFIADLDTIHIYRLLLARLHKTGRPIIVPFRCDSPDSRRFMEMQMSLVYPGQVEFASRVVREEPRPHVTLLDPIVEPTEEQIKVCSWCKRIMIDEFIWVEAEEAIEALKFFSGDKPCEVTHGMCPQCFESFTADLKH